MPKRRRFAKNFIGGEQGSMTVEFVVLVPMLLAALVFSFEFSRALWAYDVMTRDVRGGVRYLSRIPVTATTTQQAQCLAMTGIPAGAPPTCSNNAKHFPWSAESNFTAVAAIAFTVANYNQNGSILTMQANVPVPLSFMSFLNTFAGTSLATTYTLSVSDQARWIGD